jgi:hypothetical protein
LQPNFGGIVLGGTTHGSLQQSLLEIGSVVSEDFFLISSSLFSIFSLAAILVGSQDHRTQFWKGPSKDHSTKIWLKLAQWIRGVDKMQKANDRWTMDAQW